MTRRRLPVPLSVEQAVAEPQNPSRRRFLVGTGAAGAVLAAGCATGGIEGGVTGPSSTSTTAPDRARRFFTPHEAALVEAATARILPGSPDDPGAREAEVVVYIDGLLSAGGWASEPVYRSGPFPSPDDLLEEEDEDEDEDEEDDGGGEDDEEDDPVDLGTTPFGVTRRPIGALERWGEQSMVPPPDVYRLGLAGLDGWAEEREGAPFLELDDEAQDRVLADLEDGLATTFDEVSGEDLFALLRQHTIEGAFSDPIYGGNRNMVGWELIGWPGAQRAYSTTDLQTEAPPRPPQSLEHLPHAHPGETDRDEPVQPLAGTESALASMRRRFDEWCEVTRS